MDEFKMHFLARSGDVWVRVRQGMSKREQGRG